MPAIDHSSLAAFDAAVRDVLKHDIALDPLAGAPQHAYQVVAALVAAVADGPDAVAQRLREGLGRSLDEDTPPLYDLDVPEPESAPDAERSRGAADSVSEFLAERGMQEDAARALAAAVTEAVAEHLVSSYRAETSQPGANRGDGDAAAAGADRSYGIP